MTTNNYAENSYADNPDAAAAGIMPPDLDEAASDDYRVKQELRARTANLPAVAAARRARSGPLPDGLYWTDVVAAAVGRQDPSDQRSPAQVKFAFVIVEGDYRGRRLWLNIGVANDAGMRVLGDCMNLLGLANMADLLEVLPQLAGVRWQVQCKTVTQENGKEYRNVYPRARGADGRDMPALLAQMRLLQPEHSWPFAS